MPQNMIALHLSSFLHRRQPQTDTQNEKRKKYIYPVNCTTYSEKRP